MHFFQYIVTLWDVLGCFGMFLSSFLWMLYVVGQGSAMRHFRPNQHGSEPKVPDLGDSSGLCFLHLGPHLHLGRRLRSVTQMFPSFRSNNVITYMTPWWIAACIFQCCWTLCLCGKRGSELHYVMVVYHILSSTMTGITLSKLLKPVSIILSWAIIISSHLISSYLIKNHHHHHNHLIIIIIIKER